MRLAPLLLLLAACDDADCPGPATLKTDGVARWCAMASGAREGLYEERVGDVVTVEGQYAAGQQTGSWKWRWPSGALREVGQFDRDQPTGTWRRFTEDGTELPPRRRGRVRFTSDGVVLPGAHPDPTVVSTTWLGAPVGTPRRVGNIVLAPQVTGITAVDAATGEVLWEADAASRLAPTPLADGLRTAIAFTQSGDAFVVRLTESTPSTELLELQAQVSPAPVANDFGIAYVDREGLLRDQPLDASTRSAPAVEAVSLAISADRLIVGTEAGQVVHWERVDERERWRADLGSTIRAVHAPNWHTIYAVTTSQLIALDFATGEVRWRSALRGMHDDSVWVRGNDVLMERLGATSVRDGQTGELGEDVSAAALRGPIVAVDPSGVATADSDELRIARDGRVTLHARLDHPAPPLIETDGAWVGTRSGLLLHLRPTRSEPPRTAYWAGRSLTRLTVGGAATTASRWVAWNDEGVGALRLALPLGDQRGAETTLTTHWLDLPGDRGPQQRTWAPGWTHHSEPAWHTTLGEVDLITTQTPPPRQPRSGTWTVSGLVAQGDQWTHIDALEVRTTEEGPELVAGDWTVPLSSARSGAWRRVELTTATWSGVPVVPWVEAWTVMPEGWLGWSQAPTHAPTQPAGETDL